jgi:hypothetical protein
VGSGFGALYRNLVRLSLAGLGRSGQWSPERVLQMMDRRRKPRVALPEKRESVRGPSRHFAAAQAVSKAGEIPRCRGCHGNMPLFSAIRGTVERGYGPVTLRCRGTRPLSESTI